MNPEYPVYVISKGRWESSLTAKFLMKEGVPFHVVVEPQEAELYAPVVGEERLKVLPFSNLGQGSIPARNWVWEDSIKRGFARHWIMDDNIRYMRRRLKRKKIRCPAGVAFKAMEDFTDRYTNVALSGPDYEGAVRKNQSVPPYRLNVHIYSCILIRNDLPFRWRGRYNEDADLCLQVLSNGWCTIQFLAFLQEKVATMRVKGGNTDELYAGDGRAHMARSLERMWPGVVETRRRFNRPQHVVKAHWKNFDTPLQRKPGLEIPEGVNEYGMKLKQVDDEVPESLSRVLGDRIEPKD